MDARDIDRIQEAKQELDGLVGIEDLSQTPFLILGNKIDIQGALSEQELRDRLQLYNTTGREEGKKIAGVRPIELFMCSVVKRVGYGEGLKWLASKIK